MSKLKILLPSILLAAVASASQSSGLPKTSRPDVFLITIDTLLADHVHCYGYDPIQTPALDELARDGIRFAHAFTPSPITNTYIPAKTLPPFVSFASTSQSLLLKSWNVNSQDLMQ